MASAATFLWPLTMHLPRSRLSFITQMCHYFCNINDLWLEHELEYSEGQFRRTPPSHFSAGYRNEIDDSNYAIDQKQKQALNRINAP
jgi:hypothetical protein